MFLYPIKCRRKITLTVIVRKKDVLYGFLPSYHFEREPATVNFPVLGYPTKKRYVLERGKQMKDREEGKRIKKWGLSARIFLALFLGGFTGVLLNAGFLEDTWLRQFLSEGLFYVVGQGFIRLMRMLVIPLVFCSLLCGVMSVDDTRKLGSVGVRTLLFYLFTTAVAVVMALGIAALFGPGKGLGLSLPVPSGKDTETVLPQGPADTLLHIIPDNVFEAFGSGTILQIILFALLFGVALGKMGERADMVKRFFTQCNEGFMTLTLLIMKLAPAGVFCLIAETFAEIGLEAVLPLLKFILCVLAALAVQLLAVYLGLLKALSGLNPVVFLRKFFPVMAFAFSTSSSNASIPISIDTLEEKLGISRGIASFTIPLGATVNMDGTSILQGVAVLFTAQAFGIPLQMTDYLTVIGTATLSSIGTAGIPGVGLVTLTMVFHAVGLPVEGIALIMGVDRILDMARTAVNVTGDAVCTAIVAAWEGKVDREKYETFSL